MKRITIRRPNEKFNKNCSYIIKIGKRTFGELKNGEEKIIEISAEFECESLQVKIQWCGSNKIRLSKVAQNGIILVKGNKFLNRKMPLFGAIFPLIGLMIFNLEIISKNVGVGIFIGFLLGIIGSVTIWRDKWLYIKEE